MMVEKRYKMKRPSTSDAEGAAQRPASIPKPQKPRSADEGSVEESWNLLIARSMNDKPDEVFDIFERYKEFKNSQMELASKTERSIRDALFFENIKFSEERDDEERRDGSENRDDPEGRGERKSNNRQAEEDRYGYKKDDDYMMQLIEKLNLKDVIQKIQSFPIVSSESSEAKSSQSGDAMQTMELKEILEKEIASSQELTRSIEALEERHKKEVEEEKIKSANLEAKLEAQERSYNERLASEQGKVKALEFKLQKLEMSFSKERSNLELNMQEESSKVESMRLKLEEVEKDYEQKLTEEQTKRSALESRVSSQETSYQFRYESAQKKINGLEQSRSLTEELLASERKKVKALEETVNGSQALLEAERKKVRSFNATEGYKSSRLEAIQAKMDDLTVEKAKMEKVINQLSNKARVLDGAQDQIANLTQELEERDLMLLSIRQIVGVGLALPSHEDSKKDLEVYSDNIKTNLKRELMLTEPTAETVSRSKFGQNEYPSDSSSCTTEANSSYFIPWRE